VIIEGLSCMCADTRADRGKSECSNTLLDGRQQRKKTINTKKGTEHEKQNE
jgi:hypothetical protein